MTVVIGSLHNRQPLLFHFLLSLGGRPGILLQQITILEQSGLPRPRIGG
jgi:hypothetical protein